jgi:hypothetical protein
MPTWGEIFREIAESELDPPYDPVRRKYLVQVSAYTGRDTILYATTWTQDANVPPELISISDEDLQGLMEVVHGLNGPNLDLILHSPGGSPEAAEALMLYLRSKFDHIRVVVPRLAMSAATMMACAADRIVTTCEAVTAMAESVVRGWLERYMFRGEPDGAETAKASASWLASHEEFKSRSRHLDRATLERHKLKIEPLESDQVQQDLFLSVFHATTHTLAQTAAVKIIENNLGRAFVRTVLPPAATRT